MHANTHREIHTKYTPSNLHMEAQEKPDKTIVSSKNPAGGNTIHSFKLYYRVSIAKIEG